MSEVELACPPGQRAPIHQCRAGPGELTLAPLGLLPAGRATDTSIWDDYDRLKLK